MSPLLKIIPALLLFCCCTFNTLQAQQTQTIPTNAKRLIKAYPDCIKKYENNYIVFKDDSKLLFDDGKKKTQDELLKSPDIEDSFIFPYIKGKPTLFPEKNQDPGRIRNDELLKKMYGNTSGEVQKNLTTIDWCPKLVGQKIRVTSKNNAHIQLQKVSSELDNHPEWKKYLKSSGGFNWRIISGTDRLSTHSFGIAIDLNTTYSNYWQWDCKCTSEKTDLTYKNQIPQEIVDIFEKYGFIWGGKWYHYDTMHFEYRPELLSE